MGREGEEEEEKGEELEEEEEEEEEGGRERKTFLLFPLERCNFFSPKLKFECFSCYYSCL